MKPKPFKVDRPTTRTDVPEIPPPDTGRYEGKGLGLALKQRDSAKYAAIVAALTAGNSLREVASEFGVSKNTAGAISLRELGADAVRHATVANLTRLVHACSEDLLSELDGIAPAQKAVIMGIAQDKLMALDAKHTPAMTLQQVNVTANISDAAVERLIAAATKQTKPQTIIDITP